MGAGGICPLLALACPHWEFVPTTHSYSVYAKFYSLHYKLLAAGTYTEIIMPAEKEYVTWSSKLLCDGYADALMSTFH